MATLSPAGPERTFRYSAVRRDGQAVSDLVRAEDERGALRRLSAEGLVVTRLSEVGAATARGGARRGLRLSERVLIMRQLSLMLEAGVSLLEALETVTVGVTASEGRAQLQKVAVALKGGASFGQALLEHMPGFPFYVYAMANVGEASGRVAEVLGDAAEQMAYEDRLRREVLNALTYPAFLACAGTAAVGFIFVEVVPRFSAMLSQNNAQMPAISRAVLGTGEFVSQHLLLVGITVLAVAALIGLAATRPEVKRGAYGLLRRLPLTGAVVKAREIAIWARLNAFALDHGVGLLNAMTLARQAAPAGPLHEGLRAAETDLKAGVPLDAALGRRTALTSMDLSLLRAGQKSGSLARMFAFLADGYDARLKDTMKRATALAEPLAIGVISIFVGVIVLSLVLALSSLYQTVG